MARKTNKTSVIIIGIVLFLLALFNSIEPAKISDNLTIPVPATSNIADGELTIHYIDVGQADSILITLNDSSMLIDAGNNADGTDVVEYISSQGISSLDYVIGTHPHEDHIGGLDDVIKAFNIDMLLMPKAITTTKTFEDVLDAATSKNLSITSPKVGDSYELSNAKFTILACKNKNAEELNSVSIVIRLVYGDQSYLFCGDAETESETEMLSSGLTLESNVVKIGHHGSSTSSSEKFLKAVDPEIAIISVGKDNDYGHPHNKILKRLNKLGITTYRTDLCGTIVITSDGITNSIKTKKSK